jgi:type VI secretion system secreted protein VgrG
MNALNFDHSHHKLKIRGLSSPPDVLSFEGREHLSQPFCYDIQFTSRDKTLEPEAVLMQDGALSLCAPPVQGMPVQVPLRTLYGVITGFKQLSTSRDETRYEVRLEPGWRCSPAAIRTPSTRTRACRRLSRKSCVSATGCSARTSFSP